MEVFRLDPRKNKKKMYMNKNGSGFIKQYNEESTVIGTSYGSPLDPKIPRPESTPEPNQAAQTNRRQGKGDA